MLQHTLRMYRDSMAGLRPEVWYLSIVLLINRSGSMMLPFLTVYLTSARNFSLTEAGLVMSSFGVGSLVGAYTGGYLTDRFGFYPVQQWTLIISGFLYYWLGQQTELYPIMASIFVLSLVADAFRPANQTALSYYSKPENRARAFGLLRLAANLGFSLGPAIGGLLIGGLGFQSIFIVNALSCVMAAVVFRLLLPPGRQAAREETLPEMEEGAPRSRSAYTDPTFIWFVFCVMLGALSFMQFFSSLPIYMKEHLHYSESKFGLLLGLNGFLIVLTEMPLVHQLSLRYRTMPLIVIGHLCMGLAYFMLLGAGWSIGFSLLYIVIITVGEMLSMPFTNTYVAEISPPDRRGEYMGGLGLSWALAFILAPLGLRTAEVYGFYTLWIVTGVLAIVASVGLYALGRYKTAV